MVVTDNIKIADILDDIAQRLSLRENPPLFKVRAYKNAAQSVRFMLEDIRELANASSSKKLKEVGGIGSSIAKKVKEFFETGKIKYPSPLCRLCLSEATITVNQGARLSTLSLKLFCRQVP